MTTHIKISGLHCNACQILIKKRVQRIPDVQDVAVESSGETHIIATRVISPQEVEQVLQGTNYTIIN